MELLRYLKSELYRCTRRRSFPFLLLGTMFGGLFTGSMGFLALVSACYFGVSLITEYAVSGESIYHVWKNTAAGGTGRAALWFGKLAFELLLAAVLAAAAFLPFWITGYREQEALWFAASLPLWLFGLAASHLLCMLLPTSFAFLLWIPAAFLPPFYSLLTQIGMVSRPRQLTWHWIAGVGGTVVLSVIGWLIFRRREIS